MSSLRNMLWYVAFIFSLVVLPVGVVIQFSFLAVLAHFVWNGKLLISDESLLKLMVLGSLMVWGLFVLALHSWRRVAGESEYRVSVPVAALRWNGVGLFFSMGGYLLTFLVGYPPVAFLIALLFFAGFAYFFHHKIS